MKNRCIFLAVLLLLLSGFFLSFRVSAQQIPIKNFDFRYSIYIDAITDELVITLYPRTVGVTEKDGFVIFNGFMNFLPENPGKTILRLDNRWQYADLNIWRVYKTARGFVTGDLNFSIGNLPVLNPYKPLAPLNAIKLDRLEVSDFYSFMAAPRLMANFSNTQIAIFHPDRLPLVPSPYDVIEVFCIDFSLDPDEIVVFTLSDEGGDLAPVSDDMLCYASGVIIDKENQRIIKPSRQDFKSSEHIWVGSFLTRK